jgi:ketosteroid isomerase-like protein
MHTTSTSKQFLTAVFAETARGNGRLFVEALAEDVEWRIIGTTSWSKTFVGKPTVLKELLGPLNRQFAGGNTIIAHRVLGEGDYVVVEARGRNRTKAGKSYENEYCWVIMMRDGKMARIIEYADTALMESALDPLSEYEPKASAAGGTGEA